MPNPYQKIIKKHYAGIISIMVIIILQLIAMIAVTFTLVNRIYENRMNANFEIQRLEREIYNLENEVKKLEVELEVELENLKDFNALVGATFRLETGNGTSYLWNEHNNAGGIKCGVVYCSYDSEQDGMKALASLLERYVDKYGYDFKAIRYEYCGSHCGDVDLQTFKTIYHEERND